MSSPFLKLKWKFHFFLNLREWRLFFNCYFITVVKINFLIGRKKKNTKKQKTTFFPPWHRINLGSSPLRAIALPLSYGDVGGKWQINFDIYISSREKSDSIDINTVFFLRTCVRAAAKTFTVDSYVIVMINVGTAAKCGQMLRIQAIYTSTWFDVTTLRC